MRRPSWGTNGTNATASRCAPGAAMSRLATPWPRLRWSPTAELSALRLQRRRSRHGDLRALGPAAVRRNAAKNGCRASTTTRCSRTRNSCRAPCPGPVAACAAMGARAAALAVLRRDADEQPRRQPWRHLAGRPLGWELNLTGKYFPSRSVYHPGQYRGTGPRCRASTTPSRPV